MDALKEVYEQLALLPLGNAAQSWPVLVVRIKDALKEAIELDMMEEATEFMAWFKSFRQSHPEHAAPDESACALALHQIRRFIWLMSKVPVAVVAAPVAAVAPPPAPDVPMRDVEQADTVDGAAEIIPDATRNQVARILPAGPAVAAAVFDGVKIEREEPSDGEDDDIDIGPQAAANARRSERLNRGTGAVRKQDMGILTEDYRNLGPRQKTCTLENRDPGQPRTIPFGWVLCRESELANLNSLRSLIQGAPSHRIQTRIGWSAPNRRVAEAELILLAADDDIDYLQFTNKTPIPLDFLFRCQLSKSLPLFELRELNSKKDVKLIGVLSLDTNGNVVLKIGIYLTESALVYGRDEEDNGTLSPGLVPGQWKHFLRVLSCMAKQSESSSLKYFELDRHARDSFFSMAPYFSPADANLCSLNPSDLLHAVRPLGSAPTTEEVIPGLAVERLFPHQRKNLYRLLEIEARDDVTPQSGVPHPFYLPIRISSERWAEFGGLPPPIEGAPVTLYIDELTGTVTERRFDAPPLPRACILGDAPGLGKTVTALALLAKTTDLSKPLKPHPPRPEDPEQLSCVDATLIVVPNHLSWQWIEELRSRLPGFKIHLHEIEPKSTVPQQRASGRTRQNEVERLIPDGPVIGGARGSEFRRARENGVESIRLQRFGTHHIVLTTFGGSGSSSKWEDLSSVHWKRMIVDECQNLRAENSRMLELLLSVNCGSRIILGGTPFHADRIQSLYAYCWFFGMKAFEFSDTIDRLLQPVFDADPQSAAASRLRGLIAHILLRYTKDDVVIPPLHESVMRVKLSLRDQWLYERAKFAAHVKLETAVQARNQLRRHWIRCSLQPDEFKENLSTAEIGAVERHVNHLRLRASMPDESLEQPPGLLSHFRRTTVEQVIAAGKRTWQTELKEARKQRFYHALDILTFLGDRYTRKDQFDAADARLLESVAVVLDSLSSPAHSKYLNGIQVSPRWRSIKNAIQTLSDDAPVSARLKGLAGQSKEVGNLNWTPDDHHDNLHAFEESQKRLKHAETALRYYNNLQPGTGGLEMENTCYTCESSIQNVWGAAVCCGVHARQCPRCLIATTTDELRFDQGLYWRCPHNCEQPVPLSSMSLLVGDDNAQVPDDIQIPPAVSKDRLVRQYGSKVAHVARAIRKRITDVPDSKAIVFCSFRDVLDRVESALDDLKIRSVQYHGQTKSATQALHEIRSDPGVKVLLMPLQDKVVSGLNLTCCDVAYIMDPAKITGIEEQAKNRIHRIGQQRETFLYRVVAENTVDENMLVSRLSGLKPKSEANLRLLIAGDIGDGDADEGQDDGNDGDGDDDMMVVDD